jgi:hypothetical protein
MKKEQLKIVKTSLTNLETAKITLTQAVNNAIAVLDDEFNTLTSLQETMQGDYDDMSEKVQEGEKGEALNNEIDKIGEILDQLGTGKDEADEFDPFDPVIDTIKEIDGIE